MLIYNTSDYKFTSKTFVNILYVMEDVKTCESDENSKLVIMIQLLSKEIIPLR